MRHPLDTVGDTLRALVPSLALLGCTVTFVHGKDSTPAATYWPQWRGPLGTGVAPHGDPPVEWSEEKNVKWKFEIPGSGSSTPIIWKDRIFLLTTVPSGKKEAAEEAKEAEEEASRDEPRGEGRRRGRRGRGRSRPTEPHRFVTLCLDRETSRVLWQKVGREELPHEGHHPDHGYASASPVTDGDHVVAFFGSRGLYCYDMEGNLQWEKDLGDMTTRAGFGEGASPALHGDRLVVNWDHEGDSFILALDKKSGKEIWRKARDERTSWTTPLIIEVDDRTQVVVNGKNKALGYDLRNGDVIWECGGQTENVIPTPVRRDDMVYLMSGFRGNALHAVRLGGKGDLTGSDSVVWSLKRGTPYVPSPLLYGDRLYFFSGNRAQLSCHDAKTGKAHFETARLEDLSGIYASPVGARDRVYIVDRRGTALVIKNSSSLEVLATNRLDDRIDASPAIVGKQMFLRGHKYLYCLAETTVSKF